MNKSHLAITTGILGLSLGLIINTESRNTGIITGLLGVGSLGISMMVNPPSKKEDPRKLKSELNKTQTELRTLTVKLTTTEAKETSARLELAETKQKLSNAIEVLKTCESERLQGLSTIESLNSELTQKVEAIKKLEENIETLQDEIDEWDRSFESHLEEKFQDALRTRIKQIESENDEITREAIQLCKEYRDWADKAATRNVERGDFVRDITRTYSNKISEVREDWDKTVSEYLTQIELLNGKVAVLQQKLNAVLNGDLTQPELFECGFAIEGRIANGICEWLWNHHQIPLKVTGFEVNDGVITAGYAYSRSMPVEALVRTIEDESAQITRSLGLYAIEKPQKLQIADVFTVRVRRERPARKSDKGSLYRSKEEFIKYILSQPVRLRIVGEPGSGKTPSTAIILAHLLIRGFLSANTPNGQKLPHCIIESCNPLAGISVKNSDSLDFCLRWNDGKKGFKGLSEEYRFRKNPDNAEYTSSVGYIWVSDEIDVTMADATKDEAKPFKDALKDGGHINIGVIVMGQSANISTSKGLSIDDQKMMTNIYIDPVSIRTFLTQYGERFYSKKAVEKALNTLEELELEIEEQNERICDTAREFRIAMVTANRSPIFYQLPYFDSIQIDVEAYQQTQAKVSEIRDGRGETRVVGSVLTDSESPDTASVSQCRDTSRHSPMSGLATRPDTSVKPTCPHCGSDRIRSKGSKWLCQNPEHSTIAPGKSKEWKK